MKFEILAERNANDKKIFFYDNVTNTLTREDDQHIFEYQKIEPHNFKVATVFDKNNPLKKSKKVTLLKIQLGLSCNYTCDYCSQKFVERPTETSKKDIDALIEMLEKLEFDEERGLKIEFWGGEPLVYWKTLKPLAEEIKEKFSHWRDGPRLSIITNGSILDSEKNDFLDFTAIGSLPASLPFSLTERSPISFKAL
jgi:uncharacterized protein